MMADTASLMLADAAALMSILSTAWYFLLVVLGFALVIFVHELGHFIAARMVDIKVETFAIGFGPRLFGFRGKETDYCVRAIPFGGYVKMLGQEDATIDMERLEQTKVDPRSFLAKTPEQRMLVVSGGVFMNVVFAVIAFIIAFMHGVERPAPIVGMVTPNSAAEKAGLKTGDEIVRINGEDIMTFQEVQIAIMLASKDHPVDIEYRRDGQVAQTEVKSIWNEDTKALMIGIGGAATTTVEFPGLGHLGDQRLQAGDEIVSVAGTPVRYYSEIQTQLCEVARGKPVDLIVKRKDAAGAEQTLTIAKRAYLVLRPPMTAGVEGAASQAAVSENVLGLMPRCMFIDVLDYKPAEPNADQAWPMDIIVRVANIANPSKRELQDYLRDHRNEEISLEVLREGKRKTVKLKVPKPQELLESQIAMIGVDDTHAIVADTVEGSPISTLGIQRGAQITLCDDTAVEDWCDIVEYLRTHAGKTVTLTWRFGDTIATGAIDVPNGENPQWLESVAYATDISTTGCNVLIQSSNPMTAMALGVRQTWYFMKMVYVTIVRMVYDRTVEAKKMGGPIYILHIGKTVAESGFFRLLYFLGLISANLAVVNFLPLPVVDGGLFLFLLYERLRGKPVSPKAMAIWQGIGLCLFFMLFVLLTFNDLRRIITGDS
jgi:regulator of sigma E protease